MKKKKITLLAAVLATAAMFTGCTIEDEYVPVDTEVQVMETNNIIQVGTYGEKISVVYDISIKKPGSDKYYTKSVMSTLCVPVSQKLNKKDIITGKPVE